MLGRYHQTVSSSEDVDGDGETYGRVNYEERGQQGQRMLEGRGLHKSTELGRWALSPGEPASTPADTLAM